MTIGVKSTYSTYHDRSRISTVFWTVPTRRYHISDTNSSSWFRILLFLATGFDHRFFSSCEITIKHYMKVTDKDEEISNSTRKLFHLVQIYFFGRFSLLVAKNWAVNFVSFWTAVECFNLIREMPPLIKLQDEFEKIAQLS